MSTSTHSDVLLSDILPEGVAIVRLNRPDARNALNMTLRQALAAQFRELAANEQIRCVVIAGNGPHFAAGADLREMQNCGPADVLAMDVLSLWRVIAEFPKPLIAAIHGAALGGGCELAMHADIIVAEETATLGQPEVVVGVMPGGGATQRLMRAVGKFRAMPLLLTGQPVKAPEAHSMGLVSEVVGDGQAVARATEIAKLIASRPAMAVRLTKEVALAGADASLAAGLMMERRAFETLFDTKDQKEGMSAFLERRTPRFNEN